MSYVNRPAHYPYTANSGIYDAQAFSVGESETIHDPAKFPDGNKVIATCGVYGWAVERDARIASWRADSPNCPRCNDK